MWAFSGIFHIERRHVTHGKAKMAIHVLRHTTKNVIIIFSHVAITHLARFVASVIILAGVSPHYKRISDHQTVAIYFIESNASRLA